MRDKFFDRTSRFAFWFLSELWTPNQLLGGGFSHRSTDRSLCGFLRGKKERKRICVAREFSNKVEVAVDCEMKRTNANTPAFATTRNRSTRRRRKMRRKNLQTFKEK